MNPPIYISSDDYPKLRNLAAGLAGAKAPRNVAKLASELDRAVVLEGRALPSRIVRLGSRVELEDLDSGEVDAYVLCLPNQADLEKGYLSVLAPIGTAILGYGEDDTLDWETPGGVRRIKIRSVAQPALA